MAHPGSAAGEIVPGKVDDDDDGVLPLENAVELAPEHYTARANRKRRRGGTEASKKRRRENRGLYQLNLDELYIIFANVYPMDLLNLARTCKYLRGLLMHKASSFLWKTALRRVEGLPDCPADLDEPEYTNLVFYSRCHGCGKSSAAIFWNMRRRYCPACRVEKFCHLCFSDEIIRENEVLPRDWCTIGKDVGKWVDRDQMDSFMREYRSSSDKTQFLDEKRKQYQIISLHASYCKCWQATKGRVHRLDLDILREERQANWYSIFDRLRERGYGPEFEYFGDEFIEESCKVYLKKHQPLADCEWNQIWPRWVKIMDNFRLQRIEATVYLPRRRSLMLEYERYVMHPYSDEPTFDLLPHVVDVGRFPPFRDIIRAPVETQLDDEPFASAFAQLPVLIDKWMQKLSSEFAELVKIPSCLSQNNISGDQDKGSGSTIRAELSRVALDKLRLACALFHANDTGPFAYPEVLSVSTRTDMMFPDFVAYLQTVGVRPRLIHCVDDLERIGSIYDRFTVGFMEEAPYIVYACGLDPNVATAEDMDHRNARLRCLVCVEGAFVMNWKQAMWHARFFHCITIGLAPLSESPRWQPVDDKYIGAIQAAEKLAQNATRHRPVWTRCLLCRPCVGDAMRCVNVLHHVLDCHKVAKENIKEGVHYKFIGVHDVCAVEMVASEL